jgi:hypothetical protein
MRRVALAIVAMSLGAPAAEAACAAPEYRALDFWLGRWRVASIEGHAVGRNEIESTLSGCALLEHWRGYSPQDRREQAGLGVHRYDAASKTWRQAWMMDTGIGYDLVGRAKEDGVVYERRGADGELAGRTTLTLLPDGRVRQHGERIDPVTGEAQTTFDFIYTREP